MRTVILVYVDSIGTSDMIKHVLDGSLQQYKPTVTVGASLNGYPIPMMNEKGEVVSDEPQA